ncbi:hypothetical protein CXG81DRAFT_18549 [Caulochytrium protostelioides]|uniref:Transcription initiation factor TFIID subunit 4 n=1 Tax=Caulochytrium protostelioides TaxID=1555241 RepID=A0A4P9X8N0_9FUNG|nr:hypothetical protein CXG81DRAFT_18549 [Caulochytrium protostelioides]|eukprot:RKP01667.1 hypothetical protein CXG81DRAFT_18549 [Caulochytrium protostelioides]
MADDPEFMSMLARLAEQGQQHYQNASNANLMRLPGQPSGAPPGPPPPGAPPGPNPALNPFSAFDFGDILGTGTGGAAVTPPVASETRLSPAQRSGSGSGTAGGVPGGPPGAGGAIGGNRMPGPGQSPFPMPGQGLPGTGMPSLPNTMHYMGSPFQAAMGSPYLPAASSMPGSLPGSLPGSMPGPMPATARLSPMPALASLGQAPGLPGSPGLPPGALPPGSMSASPAMRHPNAPHGSMNPRAGPAMRPSSPMTPAAGGPGARPTMPPASSGPHGHANPAIRPPMGGGIGGVQPPANPSLSSMLSACIPPEKHTELTTLLRKYHTGVVKHDGFLSGLKALVGQQEYTVLLQALSRTRPAGPPAGAPPPQPSVPPGMPPMGAMSSPHFNPLMASMGGAGMPLGSPGMRPPGPGTPTGLPGSGPATGMPGGPPPPKGGPATAGGKAPAPGAKTAPATGPPGMPAAGGLPMTPLGGMAPGGYVGFGSVGGLPGNGPASAPKPPPNRKRSSDPPSGTVPAAPKRIRKTKAQQAAALKHLGTSGALGTASVTGSSQSSATSTPFPSSPAPGMSTSLPHAGPHQGALFLPDLVSTTSAPGHGSASVSTPGGSYLGPPLHPHRGAAGSTATPLPGTPGYDGGAGTPMNGARRTAMPPTPGSASRSVAGAHATLSTVGGGGPPQTHHGLPPPGYPVTTAAHAAAAAAATTAAPAGTPMSATATPKAPLARTGTEVSLPGVATGGGGLATASGASTPAAEAPDVNKMDLADMNDVTRYAGVDLRHEEESMQGAAFAAAQQSSSASTVPVTLSAAVQARRDALNVPRLLKLVQAHAEKHALAIDPSFVTLMALALQERVVSLMDEMVIASKHRVALFHQKLLENPPEGVAFHVVVVNDVRKALSEVPHFAADAAAMAPKNDEGEGGANGEGGAGGPGDLDGSPADGDPEADAFRFHDEDGTGRRRRRSKKTLATSARFVTERVKSKLMNNTALAAAGIKQPSWMLAGNAALSGGVAAGLKTKATFGPLVLATDAATGASGADVTGSGSGGSGGGGGGGGAAAAGGHVHGSAANGGGVKAEEPSAPKAAPVTLTRTPSSFMPTLPDGGVVRGGSGGGGGGSGSYNDGEAERGSSAKVRQVTRWIPPRERRRVTLQDALFALAQDPHLARSEVAYRWQAEVGRPTAAEAAAAAAAVSQL